MSGSGPKNTSRSQQCGNPYEPCFDSMHHIFLSSPLIPKPVARGIATNQSRYGKTSEGVPLKRKVSRFRDRNPPTHLTHNTTF